MVKKLFLTVAALVMGIVMYAQVENPVTWSAKAVNVNGNVYEIVLTGSITVTGIFMIWALTQTVL